MEAPRCWGGYPVCLPPAYCCPSGLQRLRGFSGGRIGLAPGRHDAWVSGVGLSRPAILKQFPQKKNGVTPWSNFSVCFACFSWLQRRCSSCSSSKSSLKNGSIASSGNLTFRLLSMLT
ncbi:hypothetical protein ACLKA7_011542 [Drosophila subpalustris]